MNSEVSNIGKMFPEKIGKSAKKPKPQKEPLASPIGVFDSGVGGLTVLSQIMLQLPHEDIIYLADTARVPYGSKSPDEIIEINIKILNYFEKQGVKMVVMACGTSSSIAYPVLKDNYRFPIVSLINPGARAALSATRNKKIGLIATLGTIQSGAYESEIKKINPDVEVFSEPCPLFVPLIEGGFVEADETRKVAKEYLKPLLKAGIDTLILGCTHYPHLIKVLREITGSKIAFVDPAESAVAEAKDILAQHRIANGLKHKAEYKYLVTGPVGQFEEIGGKLFGRLITNARQVEI